MLKGLSVGAIVWLLVFAGGCGEAKDKLTPDRVSVGINARQISGRYQGLEIDKKPMPVWEVRAKRAATKNLDVYAKAQFNRGALAAEHEVLVGKAEGEFGSLGFGLNYFPLSTRLVGLDVGSEMYQAKYDMHGGFGPIRQVTPDRFWGSGFNLGLVGEIPVDPEKRWQLIWGAGRNFTATRAGKAEVSLDGWYGTLGIQLNLTEKGRRKN